MPVSQEGFTAKDVKIVRSQTPGKFDLVERDDVMIVGTFEHCLEYINEAKKLNMSVAEFLYWEDEAGNQEAERYAEFGMSWVAGGGLAEDVSAAWHQFGKN